MKTACATMTEFDLTAQIIDGITEPILVHVVNKLRTFVYTKPSLTKYNSAVGSLYGLESKYDDTLAYELYNHCLLYTSRCV